MRTNHNRSRRIHFITNERILGSSFRVVDELGKQIGILNRDEALRLSRESGVDLVLISPRAVPPVVKVIDIFKYQYQIEKKEKEAKKGQKKSIIKDLKLSLFISDNDLGRIKKKVLEFIAEGHQVRLKLPLYGRELGKKDMAFELVQRFVASLEDASVVNSPKFQGNVLLTVISKKK